jgi:ribonuclease BN (tRNA processing enzyme)
MKIKVLGTRGEIKASSPYHSKHSGILIDEVLQLDLGEREFLKSHPRWVLITHLHPDHAFFVRDPLISIPKNRTQIYAPEKFSGKLEIKALNKAIHLGDYKITPIPTHHSHRVVSQAYIIEKNKNKILYTGDMIWIDKKYHRFLKGIKLIITEASFIHKGGFIKKHPQSGKLYGHNGVPDLIRLFSPFTSHLLLVHFGTWFYENMRQSRRLIKQLGRESQVQIDIGYDGMELGI